MGTLKPPPARASRKSVPPEGLPRFSACPVRCAPDFVGFQFRGHQAAMGGRKQRTRRTTMTDTKTNENAGSKAPTHIAYHVRDGKDKGYFTRIGAAWPHKDGQGFNIQLEIMPLDGRITLRLATDKKE
jgi:hypothetical protein